MFFYTAYGLGIHSEIPLPGLVTEVSISADVRIGLRKLNAAERAKDGNSNAFLGESDGVGTFLVRTGNQIFVDPVPQVDISFLATILLGPIMAVLLRQRGFAVVHASGVAINGRAIAFLGQSGAGKSTLAQAFYNRGYPIVTDDVMAISLDESFPQVLPGYPSLKLFPDVARFLGTVARATHGLHSRTDKTAHCVTWKFPRRPLPLSHIYVLAHEGRHEIELLRSQQAFIELVKNTRAMTLLRDEHSLDTNMRQCASLAAKVPIFRLKRQPLLNCLPEVVKLIEHHLA